MVLTDRTPRPAVSGEHGLARDLPGRSAERGGCVDRVDRVMESAAPRLSDCGPGPCACLYPVPDSYYLKEDGTGDMLRVALGDDYSDFRHAKTGDQYQPWNVSPHLFGGNDD